MSSRRRPILEMAPPYDDSLIRRVEEGFSSLLGFEVHFEVLETPGLLSGFIAYINGVVYDMSGKTQLANLQKHLLDSVLASTPQRKEEGDEA